MKLKTRKMDQEEIEEKEKDNVRDHDLGRK